MIGAFLGAGSFFEVAAFLSDVAFLDLGAEGAPLVAGAVEIAGAEGPLGEWLVLLIGESSQGQGSPWE
ncbi:MAG: hypothetical protein Q9Q13_05240 [Acidobacteriota bacterium]|nr:hypothetical protein [Acidobacteriota bacterium]